MASNARPARPIPNISALALSLIQTWSAWQNQTLDPVDKLDLEPPNPGTELMVRAEDIVVAVRLAEALQTRFTNTSDLLASSLFVEVIVSDDVEANLCAELMEKNLALSDDAQLGPEAGPVTIVTRASGNHDRLIDDALLRSHSLLYFSTKGSIPKQVRNGADVQLELRAISVSDLAVAFQMLCGRVPANLSSIENSSGLSIEDLSGCIRAGKRPEDSVVTIASYLNGHRKLGGGLEQAVGFGRAEWGLELKQDFEAWIRGELAWSEIPCTNLLLSGAPGTGKSTFPRLLAASLNIPLLSSGPGVWSSKGHLGDALKAMSSDFAQARLQPTVLFLDEIDALGDRRAETSTYWIQFLNHFLQLVSESVGAAGLIMIGATNNPERLDPAVKRSGRFGTHVALHLPDLESRISILHQYAGSTERRNGFAELALQTEGYSGADLEQLVSKAKANARRNREPFSPQHIQIELNRAINLLEPEKRRRIRVYDAGKAIVREVLGLNSGLPSSPMTNSEMMDLLAELMAGRAAEEIVFGDVSDIGHADLRGATTLASALELRFGMGEFGLIHLDGEHTKMLGSQNAVGPVRRHVEAAMAKSARILGENLDELERRGDRPTFRGLAAAAVWPPAALH